MQREVGQSLFLMALVGATSGVYVALGLFAIRLLG